MVKRLSIVIALIFSLVIFTCGTLAAEIEVQVNQNDPFDEFNKFGNFQFKGNLGPQLESIQLDLSDLNEKLENEEFEPLKENMLLFGFGGIGGSKEGGRFGGYFVSGQEMSVNPEATDGEPKKASLDIAYGGFIYEKALAVYNSADISTGVLMGGGTAELNLMYEKVGNFDLSKPDSKNFKKNYVLLQPKLNLHQQLSTAVGIDLSLGYLLTYDFGSNWKINGYSVSGPLGNFHTPTVNLRFSFGF